MDRWLQYLHRNHTQDELSEWARRLSYFRFCRAIGGHANDGDELVLALGYSGAADLDALKRALGGSSPPSPSIVQIAGIRVKFIVHPDRVLLSLCGADGDPFEVTSSDVVNAERVEGALLPVIDRRLDPPINDPHCVSPGHYPDFWK